MICAGIDAGSRTLKIVLVDADRLCAGGLGRGRPGHRSGSPGAGSLAEALARAKSAAGGHGRGGCHRIRSQTRAHGRHHRHGDHLPGPGRPPLRARCPDHRRHRRPGQQARSHEGERRGGRFRHERPLCGRHGAFSGDAGRPTRHPLLRVGIARRAQPHPAVISSMCVVFAESEIVGLLAAGVLPEDIVTGVQTAIATRIAAMTGRKLAEPILFTGGVALVPGMGDALGGRVGKARADRPPAAIDMRSGRGPLGRRSVYVERNSLRS